MHGQQNIKIPNGIWVLGLHFLGNIIKGSLNSFNIRTVC